MFFYKYILIFFFCCLTSLFAQNKEVSTLLQKVTQSKDIKEKKELLKILKEKLAKKNKEARQKADAIIKAKHKIPFKTYTEESLHE